MTLIQKVMAAELVVLLSFSSVGCWKPRPDDGSAPYAYHTTRIEWLHRESEFRAMQLKLLGRQPGSNFLIYKSGSNPNQLIIEAYAPGMTKEEIVLRINKIRSVIEEVADERGWTNWLSIHEQQVACQGG